MALFPAPKVFAIKLMIIMASVWLFFSLGKKSKDGPEGLCSMIYESGLFCDLHQTAQTAMTPARDNVNSTASVQLARKLSVNASALPVARETIPCDEHKPHI